MKPHPGARLRHGLVGGRLVSGINSARSCATQAPPHSCAIQRQLKKGITYTINNAIPSYGNDPFFIKKARESKEFLEKHDFPKELMSK